MEFKDNVQFIEGNQNFIETPKTMDGFHEIKRFPDILRKEHFVSLIASALVQVAPIVVKGGKYYSKLIEPTDQLNEFEKTNNDLSCLALCVVFRDHDKPGINWIKPNIINGVSFDFEYAHFNKKDLNTYALRLDLLVAKVRLAEKEEITKMIEQAKTFKSFISGADGKKFIEANMKIAKYTENSVEKVQKILLQRINEFDSLLQKILQEK